MACSPEMAIPDYAELHARSNFTFLTGASHPEELITRADELGYAALALTDECSLAGVVRAHVAARDLGCRLIIGSEIQLVDGPRLVLLATDRDAYGSLCSVLTRGRRHAEKGSYRLTRADLEAMPLSGLLALWLPAAIPDPAAGAWLKACFGTSSWLGVSLTANGDDRTRLAQLLATARQLAITPVALGGVLMHRPERKALQDLLTAIRRRQSIHSVGYALQPNAEHSLKPRELLLRRFPAPLLAETVAIAERCTFSLDTLRYEYPEELVPQGHSASSWLRELTEQGLQRRYPQGITAAVRQLIDRELTLIAELAYEPYFLTVEDLVRFARQRSILCQGRGSAANSAVCYALGITEVDPTRMSLLFERFLSKERHEPPDIDVDFEHERREEVIQYLYAKYGRERAALTATVISYRPRSAIRDVGRALDLDPVIVERLAGSIQWWDGKAIADERIREAGLDPTHPALARALGMARELLGFPRHLSQHVGGFVIARRSLAELVPVENAAMPERTVIQWDKDDLDTLGLLKVDVLALGMLSAIRRALEWVGIRHGRRFELADVPAEDPETYAMISRADTVGVFQIESRAQMAMLPRLRPRCFYDLVIEVAIIRPGPIQGDMVHPYLRRRNGLETVSYPSDAVRGVLERTLGVPIFQEQVMQIAIVAAGFSPGEADQLRRAMAAWKRRGGLGPFEQRLTEGMLARGYSASFAQALFQQILGFGEYGFPESHAASFALLVYVSAWLKCHEPAAFTAALLNSQPMGFYAPAQLVRDARDHGVQVLPVDVRESAIEATLVGEPPAIRLGLGQIRGLCQAAAERIVARRSPALLASIEALAAGAELDVRALTTLADSGALATLTGNRHQANWSTRGIAPPTPLFPVATPTVGIPLLRPPREGEDIVADYRSLRLTLGRHPLALLRARLARDGLLTAQALGAQNAGERATVCGLVLVRQRPGTASGVTFVTLEDETGIVNLIVWRSVAERYRRALLESRLLAATGTVQREGAVLHLIVERLSDRSRDLGALATVARNFH